MAHYRLYFSTLIKQKSLKGFLAIALTFCSLSALSQDSPDPAVTEINKKYEQEYERLRQQGEDLSKKAPDGAENAVGFDIDFSKQKDVSFDIPEFRMKRQKIVLDLPSVTMKLKRIVWDNPETTMVLKKVGQYPEIHGWTVKWKDILTDVPEVRMVRREASLHLPEFHMSRNELIFDLPEIFKTSRVQFKIPEIKFRTTEQGKQEVKDGSEQIAGAADILAKAQKAELIAHTRQVLASQKSTLEAQRSQAIAQMTDAIEQVRQAGLDPAAIPQEGGVKLNLVAQLQETEKSFNTALAQIDAALQQLEA